MIATIAVAQLQSDADVNRNLERAFDVIQRAARRGAQMVVFPEIYMALLAPENFNTTYARSVSQTLDGLFVQGLRAAARQHGVWVVSGMLETAEHRADKIYNTTIVLDDHGEQRAAHRKTHLYDAFGHLESTIFTTGDQLFKPLETPFGRMGLFVCYELRFPEVACQQAALGVDFFVMPSAWAAGPLKEMHWQHLVISRAIENTAYMFACGQVGNGRIGRSLLVDPLGIVLAEGTEDECVLYGELDSERIASVRQKIPALQHRRPELF